MRNRIAVAITYEFLTRSPVLGFFAARSAGVPAREPATVDAASDPGKLAVVGDACSSRSSCARLSDERVLRPSLGAGVARADGKVVRDRDAGAGAGVTGLGSSSLAFSCFDASCGEPCLTSLMGKAVLVTLRACCRWRSVGSFGSSLPTLVARTRPGAPDLEPFFELRLGKRGESTTAGIS